MRVSTPRISANRLLITGTSFLGLTTTVGIVLGWVDGGSRRWWTAAILLLGAFALSLLITRRNHPSNNVPTALDFLPALLPTAFVLAASRWLFQPAGVRLSWLIDTWDGTTNPGVVTYSYITGSIGRDSEVLTQWEAYPRAPHFLLAQIQHLLDLFGTQSISSRTTVYALGLWVSYAFVLLAVGVLARAILDSFGITSRLSSLVVVMVQLPLGLSWFTEKTLFLHSLSFLASILASIAMLSHWLNVRRRLTASWRDVAVLALSTTVVVETFPLLLPVPLAVWFLFLLHLGCGVPTDGWKGIVVGALVLGIAAPRLYQQAVHSAATDHVSTGGHLLALPTWAVIASLVAVVVGSLRFGFSSKSSRQGVLAVVLLAIASVPGVAWIMVGNFDRTYGVNYYPKKVEIFAFIAILAFVPALILGFGWFRRVDINRRTTAFAVAMVSLLFLVLGPGRSLRLAPSESVSARLVSAALEEAAFESESIIVSGDTYSSTLASMLSNLLDERNWSRGYVNERLLGLYQQLSVRLNAEPDESLCNIPTDGRAVIVRIDGGQTSRARCRR
jgi:hypothetical protein